MQVTLACLLTYFVHHIWELFFSIYNILIDCGVVHGDIWQLGEMDFCFLYNLSEMSVCTMYRRLLWCDWQCSTKLERFVYTRLHWWHTQKKSILTKVLFTTWDKSLINLKCHYWFSLFNLHLIHIIRPSCTLPGINQQCSDCHNMQNITSLSAFAVRMYFFLIHFFLCTNIAKGRRYIGAASITPYSQ